MGKNEPYFIKIGFRVESLILQRKSWDVVGPNGGALGKSWSDEDEAAWIAKMLNEAYALGIKEGLRRKE
jgi:hypothetical protein